MARNLEEFNDKFKGKTCFILGSGCSINDHIKDNEQLRDHVTIAVNSGILSLPNADFFVSDDWEVAQWSYFQDLKESQTNVLLYEDKLEKHVSKFGDRSILFRHCKGYEMNRPYIHGKKENHIWEARSSAGSAIHIAYIMGCRNVVLLGMDCRRVGQYRYFWQMPSFEPKPKRIDSMPTDKFKQCKVAGVNSDTDLRSILRYWDMVAKKTKEYVNVVNVSEISLIKSFPKISFAESLNLGE